MNQLPDPHSTTDILSFSEEESAEWGDSQSENHQGVPDPYLGQQIGDYQCLSFLGSGATGSVYLAMHLKLGRHCALKILTPGENNSFDELKSLKRFQEEGRSTASLVHHNIVTLHAIGEDKGVHYMEMEFVAGGSLKNRILDRGVLSPVAAISMTARIATGLAAAHSKGVLHRDLKPDNILLTAAGDPKIGDFGIARQNFSQEKYELIGTPQYIAPELYQKVAPTPASDVYSLGVCCYFLLTGSVPFPATNLAELAFQICTHQLPSFREEGLNLPMEMAECLEMLLERDPGNRPANGSEAMQLIHAVLGQMRNLEILVNEAFQYVENISWKQSPVEQHRERYEVTVQIPGGRTQFVFLESTDHSASERLLNIYSLCCPAVTKYYERALRLNNQLSHGGLAIREIAGEPYFVMQNAYLRGAADPEEIRKSVLEVAKHADAVELELTGKDSH